MKKIFILLTTVLYWNVLLGQKPKNKVRVHTIVYNFLTKTFEKDSVCTTLDVKDWVNIQVKNMPQSAIISSSVTYTNRHLEDRATFGNAIKFVNPTQQNKIDNKALNSEHKITELDDNINDKTSDKNKLDEAMLIKADSLTADKKIIKSSFFKNGTVIKERPYKINEKNMEKALEISVARRFIIAQINDSNNSADNIAKAKKALENISWQTYLIKNLKDNINEKLAFRDTMIYDLSTKVKDTATYSLPIVQIENYDFTEFQINVTDTTRSATPEVIKLPFRNKKGFKLDFSTGFALSGLGNKSYSIVESERSGFLQIKEDDERFSRLSMGISLLAHAYFRNASFVNTGITSGLTVNISNQSLNYVLGGSLLLGEDQRFIISAGAIFGKTEQLKSYYKINTDISTDKLLLDQPVPVIQKFSPSVFFGVSYNLGIAGSSKKIQL